MGGFITETYLWEQLATLSANRSKERKRTIVGFSVKDMYKNLKSVNDEAFFDVQIAAYVLNPLISDYKPENIANEYLKRIMPGREELLGKKDKDATKENQIKYSVYVCDTLFNSYSVLKELLVQDNAFPLFDEIEMPTSYVLYEMEQEGIGIRKEELKAYSLALDERILELEKAIFQAAGKEFNINSPKQLGIILFEELGIEGGKKTKTGYSTAADVLDYLAPKYPIIQNIQEFRGLMKLKSTYAEGLANYISEDERIHTTFNQTIAATGRISSTEPNLQNIPIRMELGRKIRKVFVPKNGFVFVDADYSQIELRILAHMSKDETLISAYNEHKDIHALTASQVFHTPIDQVTSIQRSNAKAVNFGIVYGISAFGLSQDLSITRKEAAGYIEEYFTTYPMIKEFLDKLIEDAKEKGYSETCFGRKRPIPELKSSNFMKRSFGERVAMNAPIQGTAADVMKLAVINVYRELKKQKLESRLILQIHDEILIETKIEELEKVKKIVEDKMKHAAKFVVELEVDVHTGENWYDAK
jgi:DNA polymerase-1